MKWQEMAQLLIFHARLHGFVGRTLDQRFFADRVPEDRRLRLDDPAHSTRRRYPDDIDPLPDQTRLVSGMLPFGYFDDLRDRIMHVCVMSDPEIAFLRFAQELRGLAPASVLRMTGHSVEHLPFHDPDALVLKLLGSPAATRSRLGGLTRLCAGMPISAARPATPDDLRAAEANLARVNCLCGVEPRLDAFLRYLCDVFGWTPPQRSMAGFVPQPLVAPDDLGATARRALREGVEIDRRLFLRCVENDVRQVA